MRVCTAQTTTASAPNATLYVKIDELQAESLHKAWVLDKGFDPRQDLADLSRGASDLHLPLGSDYDQGLNVWGTRWYITRLLL